MDGTFYILSDMAFVLLCSHCTLDYAQSLKYPKVSMLVPRPFEANGLDSCTQVVHHESCLGQASLQVCLFYLVTERFGNTYCNLRFH